jgi:hypothetical protein
MNSMIHLHQYQQQHFYKLQHRLMKHEKQLVQKKYAFQIDLFDFI